VAKRPASHDGSYVVLSERADSTVAQLAAVELLQLARTVKIAQQPGAPTNLYRDKLRVARYTKFPKGSTLYQGSGLPRGTAPLRSKTRTTHTQRQRGDTATLSASFSFLAPHGQFFSSSTYATLALC
jgi:hypothetical protein